MDGEHVKSSIPHWYQDLSIPQMENVLSLGNIMRADYVERVTDRTRQALNDIGITSTFVKITPEQIRQLRRLTDLDPVKFLCEIYRIVTGQYFTDEQYKKSYDCNERIILSAIAFLTLPEIIVELHKRLPMPPSPKLPPKPTPPIMPRRKKGISPYLDPEFTKPPNWLHYRKSLWLWRKKCEKIAIPRVILPPNDDYYRSVKRGASRQENMENSAEEPSEPNEIDEKEHGGETLDKSFEKTTTKVSESEAASKIIGESKFPSERVTENPDKNTEDKSFEREIGSEGTKSDLRSREQSRREHSAIVPRKSQKSASEIGEDKSKRKSRPTSHRKKHDRSEDKNETVEKKPRPGSHSDKKHAEEIDGDDAKKKSKQISARRSKHGEFERKHGRHGDRRMSKSRHRSKSKVALEDRPEDQECKNVLVLPEFDEKTINDKEKHLILSGISQNEISQVDNSLNYPVSYATSGIACVTPRNSDESFVKALNSIEAKKSFPRGREYLSMRWQEWFHNVDEEFMKMEKEADRIFESVQKTMKLIDPPAVCDGCCSCRQTRKTNDKYRKTKTPQMVVDSIVLDGQRNKLVVGSMAMNSPGPSPSESLTNVPQYIDSYDKFVKNKIVSGVTNEKGESSYLISGISKDIVHVPRRKIVPLEGPPIKNVPPCNCAIERSTNEGLMEITSDDNILWSRQDQICIGRKYRPEAGGTSSCRDYPRDKSCRRNPFKRKHDQEIEAKIRKQHSGKKDYYPRKKNMYSLPDFQPCGDEDGMAVCGGPWGALNVPDEEELAQRAAEEKFILESPPCGDKPGRSICGAPFGSRHPVPKKPKKDEDDDEEDEAEDDDEPKEKPKREPRQRLEDFKLSKEFHRDKRCLAAKDKSDLTDSSLPDSSPEGRIIHHQSRSARSGDGIIRPLLSRNKITRSESRFRSRSRTSNDEASDGDEVRAKSSYADTKERKRRSRENERITKSWIRMKRMASKLLPASIDFPEDPPGRCQREESRASCCGGRRPPKSEKPPSVVGPEEGPFNWRTESEEALPAQKTLMYLIDPDEPVKKVPVRPGGKPCLCRENRNAKKKLLYNIASLTTDRKTNRKRDENVSRVIDGLLYVTPTPSVRNSEEYIPEYELSESPYEKCTRELRHATYDSDYIDKYLGPASLMKKQNNGAISCSGMREKMAESAPKQESEAKENKSDETKGIKEEKMKSAEKDERLMKNKEIMEDGKWTRACDDQDLVEFYSRCRDNVPCWLRCVEFSKDGCCLAPRRLRVVRPVCECKYEKKIVKRDEERKSWISRQERLKSHKKQPYSRLEGFSRPLESETKLIISEVKKGAPGKKSEDDKYHHVAGVSKVQILTSGENVVGGIGMHTPITTPEASKQKLPIVIKEHRHWSLTEIPGTRLLSNTNGTLLLGEASDASWNKKITASQDKRVESFFESSRILDDESRVESRVLKTDSSLRKEGKKTDYRTKIKNDHPGEEKRLSFRKDGSSGVGNKEDYSQKRRKSKIARGKERDAIHKEKKSGFRHSLKNESSKDQSKNKAFNNNKKSSIRYSLKNGNLGHESRTEAQEENQLPSESPTKTEEKAKKEQTVSPDIQPLNSKSEELKQTEIEAKDSQRIVQQTTRVDKLDENTLGEKSGTQQQGTVNVPSGKINLKELMKAELENLAEEGFLFARLPACHKMPQLQWWIMYRKGLALPEEEKQKLMDQSLKIWKSMEKGKPKKMKAPDLGIPKKVLDSLTWDQADEIKQQVNVVQQQIALKRAQFYSDLRKSRILNTRTTWGLMEFGKFPGVAFKKAFFVYQASKESDGFVFKPWQNSENENE